MSKTHNSSERRNFTWPKPDVKKMLNFNNEQTNANSVNNGIYFHLSDQHILKIENTQCTELWELKRGHILFKYVVVNWHNLFKGNLVNSIKTENVYAI